MRLHGSEASERASHEEQERCFLLKTEARPAYNEDVCILDRRHRIQNHTMESSHPKLTKYSDQYVPLAISSNFLLPRASNILLDYSQLEQPTDLILLTVVHPLNCHLQMVAVGMVIPSLILPGPKFVRLYFYPASYPNLDISKSYFKLSANTYQLLNNFSASLTVSAIRPPVDYFTKEFIITVWDDQKLELTFIPTGDTGMYRTWHEDSGISLEKLETLHMSQASRIEYTTKTPAYSAPVLVYSTMRSMGPEPLLNKNYNLTWIFPVDAGFNYLLRLHFCETRKEFKSVNRQDPTLSQQWLLHQRTTSKSTRQKNGQKIINTYGYSHRWRFHSGAESHSRSTVSTRESVTQSDPDQRARGVFSEIIDPKAR
ncbi:hypothetical protein D5086_030757 [Populus alba]|uniref:Uncharacterized protein n=1 Tax=Populus alba TaxID=43335 RepID=A0ACC4API8_POPAL